METRFKLTADGDIHIDDGTLSYTDTLANALVDIAAAGITIDTPNLASESAIAIVGFEVSAIKKDFILENGWHYPMNEVQAAQYQQYVDCIDHLLAITTEKSIRLGEDEDTPTNGEPAP